MKHLKPHPIQEASLGARRFLKQERINGINQVDWPGVNGASPPFKTTLYHGSCNRLAPITLDNLTIERSIEDLLMKYGSSKLGCLGFYLTPIKGDLMGIQRGIPKPASKYAIEKARKLADKVGLSKAKAQIYQVELDPDAIITNYYPGGCIGRAFSRGQQEAEKRLIELSDGFQGNDEIAVINPDIITGIELIEEASLQEILNNFNKTGLDV